MFQREISSRMCLRPSVITICPLFLARYSIDELEAMITSSRSVAASAPPALTTGLSSLTSVTHLFTLGLFGADHLPILRDIGDFRWSGSIPSHPFEGDDEKFLRMSEELGRDIVEKGRATVSWTTYLDLLQCKEERVAWQSRE
jgi:hypothetical protein